MAKAGETPEAQFEQGDSLQYGQAHAANALMGLIPATTQQDYAPKGDAENFIFNDTARPHEPVTHGAPFGAGMPVVAGAGDTDNEVVTRVAQQLEQQPVGADTKAWLARARQEG